MSTSAQAIENMRREKRAEASGGSPKKLADVERAALAYQAKVIERKAKLASDGDLTAQAINREIAGDVIAWNEEKKHLIEIIESVEHAANLRTSDGLPERTATHQEISAHFKTLKGDERQVAIVRAIMGRDMPLAEALATEPPSMSTLIAADRELIVRRVTDPDTLATNERQSDTLARAKAARATINNVSHQLAGVTS